MAVSVGTKPKTLEDILISSIKLRVDRVRHPKPKKEWWFAQAQTLTPQKRSIKPTEVGAPVHFGHPIAEKSLF